MAVDSRNFDRLESVQGVNEENFDQKNYPQFSSIFVEERKRRTFVFSQLLIMQIFSAILML